MKTGERSVKERQLHWALQHGIPAEALEERHGRVSWVLRRKQGITVSTGTIVDATIIAAPSSTKNATGTRDPGMHQTQKGRQWYFGMNGHFGVTARPN